MSYDAEHDQFECNSCETRTGSRTTDPQSWIIFEEGQGPIFDFCSRGCFLEKLEELEIIKPEDKPNQGPGV